MARKIEEMESELLKLDHRSRAALAKRLLESFDTLSDAEYEELWIEEAEARYRDYKAGRPRRLMATKYSRVSTTVSGEAVSIHS